ncbi:hypothetical protein OF83DRAFT_1089351 [Amylostereum chailletii]|nr:hypothetical protein OF83DRAFT_1089351 [Amylostereum chailletii]
MAPPLECDDAYMRTWLAPDLDDPELLELLKVFPSFISKRALPRFVEKGKGKATKAKKTKTKTKGRRPPADVEQGGLTETEGEMETETEGGEEGKVEVRAGTGRMWVGARERSAGWAGSWGGDEDEG